MTHSARIGRSVDQSAKGDMPMTEPKRPQLPIGFWLKKADEL